MPELFDLWYSKAHEEAQKELAAYFKSSYKPEQYILQDTNATVIASFHHKVTEHDSVELLKNMRNFLLEYPDLEYLGIGAKAESKENG